MLKLIKKGNTNWELLMQVLSGEMPEDHPDFISWLNEDEEHISLYNTLKSETLQDNSLFDTKRMYKKVSRALFGRFVFSPVFFSWLKYVAVIVLVAVSAFFYIQNRENASKIVASEERISNITIEPGSKKARLTLADGSSIELKDEFELKKENGTVIKNDTSGVISYQQQANRQIKPESHFIEVPLGGEYQLKLADGTQVYLNAGSSLRFPSFFEGDIRRVELTGEAYFNVVKNQHPFIVKVSNAEIEVLGTSFNLSAYNEDAAINATLVTGSIHMKTASNREGYLLRPGQNLNFNKSSEQVKIETVDTDLYTAWTRGEFIFRNQTMDEILTKLSKWYDFSIEFSNPAVKNLRFTGSVEKKRPLSYFLNQLEQVTTIKFKEYGKTIKVD